MSKKQAVAASTMPTAPGQIVTEGLYGDYEISRIRISPDNRKRFNEVALQELAQSIKAIGLAQPILIRPVTPTEDAPEDFEIVAGERRYRASKIAGRDTIAAVCRVLSDAEAAKLRILENLQREDPHPMEEAEGYQQLMMKHGYSADQLADEIKKSRSYVFGRLKLCALTTEVREVFLDDADKLPASIALMIARIPVPALQTKAMAEIITPQYGEPLSVRRAAQHLQNRYMLDLTSATFPIADAKLLATAGACTKCPKRTGNQPEIYEGISADVCTDPDCFDEKKAALITRKIAEANKKGIPVFHEQDEWRALAKSDNLVTARAQLYDFQRYAPNVESWRQLETVIEPDQLPAPKAYAMISNVLVPMYERTAVQLALEKAGLCETEEGMEAREAAEASSETGQTKAAAFDAIGETHRRREAAAEKESAYRIALYKQLRAKAANGFSLESLREFTKLVLMDPDNGYSLPSDVLDIYGLESHSDVAVCAHIDQASLPEVQLILVDMVLGESLSVMHWDIDNATFKVEDEDDDIQFGALREMARHEGIDPDQVRESMFPTPIDVTKMDYKDLSEFIKTKPARINELKDAVLADRNRADLVGLLELAAGHNGYVYGVDGFQLVAAGQAFAPATMTATASSDAPQPQDGDIVALESEDLEAAVAEPAPAAKAPKAKSTTAKGTKSKGTTAVAPAPVVKQTLTPAAAWPWPVTSGDALPPAAHTNSTIATPSTQEA